MKTLAIETETRMLSELLAGEKSNGVIYLTKKGRTRYALVPLDEGDEEVVAIRQNTKLMAYLTKCAKDMGEKARVKSFGGNQHKEWE